MSALLISLATCTDSFMQFLGAGIRRFGLWHFRAGSSFLSRCLAASGNASVLNKALVELLSDAFVSSWRPIYVTDCKSVRERSFALMVPE